MTKSSVRALWKHRSHIFRADEYICSRCQTPSRKPYRHCPACHAAMSKGKSDLNWIDELEIFSAMSD